MLPNAEATEGHSRSLMPSQIELNVKEGNLTKTYAKHVNGRMLAAMRFTVDSESFQTSFIIAIFIMQPSSLILNKLKQQIKSEIYKVLEKYEKRKIPLDQFLSNSLFNYKVFRPSNNCRPIPILSIKDDVVFFNPIHWPHSDSFVNAE